MTYQYLVAYKYRVLVLEKDSEDPETSYYKDEFTGSARTYVDVTSKIKSPQMIYELESTLLTDTVVNDLKKKLPEGTTCEVSTMVTALSLIRRFFGKPGSRFDSNPSMNNISETKGPAPDNISFNDDEDDEIDHEIEGEEE